MHRIKNQEAKYTKLLDFLFNIMYNIEKAKGEDYMFMAKTTKLNRHHNVCGKFNIHTCFVML